MAVVNVAATGVCVSAGLSTARYRYRLFGVGSVHAEGVSSVARAARYDWFVLVHDFFVGRGLAETLPHVFLVPAYVVSRCVSLVGAYSRVSARVSHVVGAVHEPPPLPELGRSQVYDTVVVSR